MEMFILHRDRYHHRFPLSTVVNVSVLVSVPVSGSGSVNTLLLYLTLPDLATFNEIQHFFLKQFKLECLMNNGFVCRSVQ